MLVEEIKSDICLDINVLSPSLLFPLMLSPCCFVAVKWRSLNCGLWPPKVEARGEDGQLSPLPVSLPITTEGSQRLWAAALVPANNRDFVAGTLCMLFYLVAALSTW